MERHIALVPVFFLSLLLWLVVCPFFYSLSQPEAFCALASGNYSFFFSAAAENAFNFMPTAAVLSFSAVFVFIALHKAESPASFFIFMGLLLFAFAVLEPASRSLKASFQQANEKMAKEARIALPDSGVIHEYEAGRKAVLIESTQGREAGVLVSAETSGRALAQSLRGYSNRRLHIEAFSQNALGVNAEMLQAPEKSAFLAGLAKDAEAVHFALSKEASASAGAYLWTGGAFFALAASFFFFCVLTGWNLINFAIYAAALRALYRLFPLLNGEEARTVLRRFLPQFFSDAALSALPALVLAGLIALAGFALILPRCRQRNLGAAEL